MDPPTLRFRFRAALTAFRTPSILNPRPPQPPSTPQLPPPPPPPLLPPPTTSELSHILRRRLYTLNLPDTPHLLYSEHIRHFLTLTFALASAVHLLQLEPVNKFRTSQKRLFRRLRLLCLLQLPLPRALFRPLFSIAPPLLWLLEPFRFLAIPLAIDGVARFAIEQVRRRMPDRKAKSDLEEFQTHVAKVFDEVRGKVEDVVEGVVQGVEGVVEGMVEGVKKDVEFVKEGVGKLIAGPDNARLENKQEEVPDVVQERGVHINKGRVRATQREWGIGGKGLGVVTESEDLDLDKRGA